MAKFRNHPSTYAPRLAPAHDPIAIALAEDIGAGDLTSEWFVAEGKSRARIFAKEPLVVAGGEVAREVFQRVDKRLKVSMKAKDGAKLRKGGTVLEVSGPTRSLLTAERVALNFLQQLSGVATLTRRFVDAVKPHAARIIDTRKTTPGLRALEKAAVVAGGGANHRFGLYDMVMVKDNHLAARGRDDLLQQTIYDFRAAHPGVAVEIEADTLAQVKRFLGLDGVSVILLDNMDCATMRRAVALGQGAVMFEASGGVNLDTVKAIAATGVDFISIGALTHSARAVDLSLEVL